MLNERQRKALKLIEAISEDCNVMTDGDHAWRTCRSCLAKEELEHRGIKELLRELLAGVRQLESR